MKSYIAHAVTIYEGIIADASLRWPTLRSSLEKDLSYLRRAVENRGLVFYTILLPSAGKVLDRALSTGVLVSTEFPQGYPMIQKKPKLFGDLFKQVFDDRGMLRDAPCIDAVSFLRQLLYCCKKLRVNFTDATLKESLDEFFSIEERLPRSWEDTWDSEVPVWKPRHGHPLWGVPTKETFFGLASPQTCLPSGNPIPWYAFRSLCRFVISELGTPDYWGLRTKHGPGAVSEPREFVSKYEFPTWPRKLGNWFPYDWYATGDLSMPDTDWSDYEPASRLIAVPKSQKGPRLICAEPIAHQWIQQGIWQWLEERIGKSYLADTITFRSQENSRNRALDASRHGHLATIDLSSASDRLSTRLVEFVFQGSEILEGMHASRTRVLSQDLSRGHPNRVLLRKFATMGSALTFPVQSIVFALIAVWAIRLVDNDSEFNFINLGDQCSEVTVFGDDIIVPVRAVETIELLLQELGLKVNKSKSYSEGFFRESCGCDAFMGHDVTPAYALQPYDDSPSAMATTVAVSNNFFLKGYWRTAEAVLSAIPPKELKLLRVCGSADGAFGLRSYSGSDTSHLKKGWDAKTQRSFSVSLAVTSKVRKERGRRSADLTQYFTESPDPMFNWSAGQVGSTLLRKSKVRVYD